VACSPTLKRRIRCGVLVDQLFISGYSSAWVGYLRVNTLLAPLGNGFPHDAMHQVDQESDLYLIPILYSHLFPVNKRNRSSEEAIYLIGRHGVT
jgi:hypothetical protein